MSRMILHVIYEVGQHRSSHNLALTDLRLQLPNGEVKVPHGGLSLLVEVDSPHPEAFAVNGKLVRILGRAILRRGLLTPFGGISLAFVLDGRAVECSLPVEFRRVNPLTE